MNKLSRLLLVLLIFGGYSMQAQKINDDLLQNQWRARWITGPGEITNPYRIASDKSLKEYAVYKFRKTFNLDAKPESFVVHVSGDNRYKLYVNGTQVVHGPARGDLYFWNFETVDIAKHLKAGDNVVAAVVWNDGEVKPEAQITFLTGFILQGNTSKEEVINTDDSWITIKDESYQPRAVSVPGYYVAGPGEFVDMNKHIENWTDANIDESGWAKARAMGAGSPKEASVNGRGWMLVPSPIPHMEMTGERLQATRKATGVDVPSNFPAQKSSFTIPANTEATILLDQSHLTNAYPTLEFGGGKNAAIKMAYAEALYFPGENGRPGAKGDRDDVEGKIFVGKADSIISNGKANQSYTPNWYRTYRYLELSVKTGAEPLTIHDIYGTFTGYPLEKASELHVDNDEMHKIVEIGWRTARLCAHETYMDCPYYEQLQYIGDARIQAMVTMYNTKDHRLVKQALDLMDHSRIPEGITLSRYPTDLDQQITTFSLWWVAMVYDYYMYGSDEESIKKLIPGTRQVMSFYERYQQEDGSIKDLPYWLFTDWYRGEGWDFGQAPIGDNGESAVLDMQLIYVLRLAAQVEKGLGVGELSQDYLDRADKLEATVKRKYWNEERGLFADTEKHDYFSQHANSLAILGGVVEGDQAEQIADKLLTDENLAEATIYFKYYLHLALTEAGKGNDYLNWLDKWRENIDLGLTTWAETSDVSTSRSDSHAWGSSPNVEFYRIVLGIDTDAPGFSKVKIEPHLGELEEISGSMPHPKGEIAVDYKVSNNKLSAEINLPSGVSGTFIWKGKTHDLKAGKNSLSL
ncbi:alpha-L-rhamnosidase C-terminal domain-containing protein [Roseivirga pacifica]|uniref:alpha-L-rhamnosidase-related protein n=1 Tax=Roseivirga pacifica TaxID=1267423 RepID=UPI003BAE94AD